MTQGRLSTILTILDDLEHAKPSPQEAGAKLSHVLLTMLESDGFRVSPEHAFSKPNGHTGYLDVFAHRQIDGKEERVGFEIKYSPAQTPYGTKAVQQAADYLVSSGCSGFILLTNSGLTSQATEFSKQFASSGLTCAELDHLRAWVRRLEVAGMPPPTSVQDMTIQFTRDLVRRIAENPDELRDIEWRTLEHMLNEAFAGLGFVTELTPSSKDGGRDIVMRCGYGGQARTYIVEIKHWRSGQKVKKSYVEEFVSVVLREQHESGLFISTSGYAGNACETLTEIERGKLRLGDRDTIEAVCKTYVKAQSGLWSPNLPISDIIRNTSSAPKSS